MTLEETCLLVDAELREQRSRLARASPYRSAPRIKRIVTVLEAAREHLFRLEALED